MWSRVEFTTAITDSLSSSPALDVSSSKPQLMFSHESLHRIEPFYRYQVTESHFVLLFTIRYLFQTYPLFTTKIALFSGHKGCARRLWTVSLFLSTTFSLRYPRHSDFTEDTKTNEHTYVVRRWKFRRTNTRMFLSFLDCPSQIKPFLSIGIWSLGRHPTGLVAFEGADVDWH